MQPRLPQPVPLPLHLLLDTQGLADGTMQPPRCCLLLVLLLYILFLSGIWADLEGKWEPRIIHTCTHLGWLHPCWGGGVEPGDKEG